MIQHRDRAHAVPPRLVPGIVLQPATPAGAGYQSPNPAEELRQAFGKFAGRSRLPPQVPRRTVEEAAGPAEPGLAQHCQYLVGAAGVVANHAQRWNDFNDH